MHFFLFVKFKISWNLKPLEFIPYFSMIMKKSVLTSQLYKLLEPISKIRLGFRNSKLSFAKSRNSGAWNGEKAESR
jgi:hypothetical protein